MSLMHNLLTRVFNKETTRVITSPGGSPPAASYYFSYNYPSISVMHKLLTRVFNKVITRVVNRVITRVITSLCEKKEESGRAAIKRGSNYLVEL